MQEQNRMSIHKMCLAQKGISLHMKRDFSESRLKCVSSRFRKQQNKNQGNKITNKCKSVQTNCKVDKVKKLGRIKKLRHQCRLCVHEKAWRLKVVKGALEPKIDVGHLIFKIKHDDTPASSLTKNSSNSKIERNTEKTTIFSTLFPEQIRL